MRKLMMKLANAKNTSEFYQMFPDEQSFMKIHGKEFQKAILGKKIKKADPGIDLSKLQQFSQIEKEDPLKLESWMIGNINGSGVSDNPNFAVSDDSKGFSMESLGGMMGGMEIGKDLLKNIQSLKKEKKQRQYAEQWANVSDVVLQAAKLKPEQQERKYLRPEDNINTGQEFFPIYGVGTNVLAEYGTNIPGNPSEIYNFYKGNTLYTDLGYEPLKDSSKTKAFKKGGKLAKSEDGLPIDPYGMGADQVSKLITGIGGENAGGNIGGTVGKYAGMAIGGPLGAAIGQVGGELIGRAIDSNPRKLKRANKHIENNIQQLGNINIGAGVQGQYSSFMEDGGEIEMIEPIKPVVNQYPSLELSPITQNFVFNDKYRSEANRLDNEMNILSSKPKLSVKDKAKLNELQQLKTDLWNYQNRELRTGGHVRQNNITEIDEYGMGGDLKTYWGGHAEPISQNPYLPEGGQTILFKGNSHEESDGNGRTGIGITYGNNPVEVEDGEPAVKLNDGSDTNNLVVFGNLKIPKGMLNDKDADGKKFKHYINNLSKKEDKNNKIIDDSVSKINDLDVNTPFDKLRMSSLNANILGANMQLKEIAEKKNKAAALQSAINDTAEELGVVADDLAQGKIKRAKTGANILKAVDGKGVLKTSINPSMIVDNRADNYLNYLYNGSLSEFLPIDETGIVEENNIQSEVKSKQKIDDGYKSKYGLQPWKGNLTGLGKKTASSFTAKEWDEIADRLGFKGRGNEEFQRFLMNDPRTKAIVEKRHQELYGKAPFIDKKLGYGWSDVDLKTFSNQDLPEIKLENNEFPTLEEIPIETFSETPELFDITIPQRNKFDWIKSLNSIIPYLRPSNVKELDPRQLTGEMYALSQNKLEPVYAQTIQPDLSIPHDISLQDMIAANEADYRAAERRIGNNPAALAQLQANKHLANQRILGEQFRQNQAEKARVYEQNKNILNQVKLQNLGILDMQQQRQAQAKSNTKAITQAALSSIADKYAKNQLENRTLQTYENLYNYRFDPNYRAYNMNPLWEPNMTGNDDTLSSTGLTKAQQYEALMDYYKKQDKAKQKQYSEDRTTYKNGDIIKLFKK